MSNYTSNLLCHFVGRAKPNDEERFNLLLSIVKGCELLCNINSPHNPQVTFFSDSQCEHLGEVFVRCDAVCFCDIPNEALAIHTNKYSHFGLGFEKTFIAQQGAHPVMYVPQNHPIIECGGNGEKTKSSSPKEPCKYYPYMQSKAVGSLIALEIALSSADRRLFTDTSILAPWINQLDKDVLDAISSGTIHPILYSLIKGIATQLAYVKLYDVTLPDDHPDNYYMEREWRCLQNVTFSLNDIRTVYLPDKAYEERFLCEFSNYSGSFYLFDNNERA